MYRPGYVYGGAGLIGGLALGAIAANAMAAQPAWKAGMASDMRSRSQPGMPHAESERRTRSGRRRLQVPAWDLA